MSVWGVGVDIVDVERFRQTLERTPGVRDRLFTPAEAGRSVESMAARFAAKEALVKAFRLEKQPSWHDIEIVTDDAGAPSFALRGDTADRAARDGVRAHVSLSHDAGLAVAFVVAETVNP